MSENLHRRLSEIQATLNAPKNQWNSFSNFKYRSCEDILAAVKPLLKGLNIIISDDIVMIGDRIYVKATVTITNGKESIQTTAFAREDEMKKGMDGSQITGSASSYARKYALNGLLMIDDSKDADSMDNRGNGYQKKTAAAQATNKVNVPLVLNEMRMAKTEESLKEIFAQAWRSATEDQKPVLLSSYKQYKEAVAPAPQIAREAAQEVVNTVRAKSKAERIAEKVAS